MAELGFRVVGADNHYYEPDDCSTRHMEQVYGQNTKLITQAVIPAFR